MITPRIVVALVLVGCVENGIVENAGLHDASPALETIPAQLFFGDVDWLTPTQGKLRLFNRGDASLEISAIEIESAGSGTFALLADPAPNGELRLDPGDGVSVFVSYLPEAADDQSWLTVYSNDPIAPALDVSLSGRGLFPALEARNAPLDLGFIPVGCTARSILHLYNPGGAAVELTEILATDDRMEVSEPDLPMHLAPGETFDLPVAFTPSDEGATAGDLWFQSSAPSGPLQVDVSVEGAVGSRTEEVFQQPSSDEPVLDLVFLMDHSCSMQDDIAHLAEEGPRLISALSDLDVDWQLAVVDNAEACADTIINDRTPDPATAFATALAGVDYPLSEALLSVALDALNQRQDGVCNEALAREGSILEFVAVSDEREQSTGGWRTMLSRMRALWPDVRFSAIAGDVPGGCGTADGGYGYYEAVAEADGAFLSICDSDWSDYPLALVEAGIGHPTDTFAIEGDPVPETLAVSTSDGELQGWAWDADNNAVVFAEMPAGPVALVVSYEGREDCPGGG
jgi:hypothetical protein